MRRALRKVGNAIVWTYAALLAVLYAILLAGTIFGWVFLFGHFALGWN